MAAHVDNLSWQNLQHSVLQVRLRGFASHTRGSICGTQLCPWNLLCATSPCLLCGSTAVFLQRGAARRDGKWLQRGNRWEYCFPSSFITKTTPSHTLYVHFSFLVAKPNSQTPSRTKRAHKGLRIWTAATHNLIQCLMDVLATRSFIRPQENLQLVSSTCLTHIHVAEMAVSFPASHPLLWHSGKDNKPPLGHQSSELKTHWPASGYFQHAVFPIRDQLPGDSLLLPAFSWYLSHLFLSY